MTTLDNRTHYRETRVINDITTSNELSHSVTEDESVTKGGPLPGYPFLIGKANLTSSLVGYRLQMQNLRYMSYSGTQEYPSGVAIETCSGHLYDGAAVSLPNFFNMTSVKSQLAEQLTQKCSNKLQSFKGGAVLVEIRDTLKLIRNPVQGIMRLTKSFAEAYKALVKYYKSEAFVRRFKYVKNFIKYRNARAKQDLEKLYLEWTFGVAPLFSDIEALIGRVDQLLKKKESETIITRLPDHVESSVYAGKVIPPGPCKIRILTTAAKTDTIKGMGRAKLDTTPNASVLIDPRNFGFVGSEFVPSLKEGFPFSWFVDYFTNLNEVVTARYFDTSRVVWWWMGAERVQQSDITQTPVPSTANGTPKSTVIGRYRYIKRTVYRYDDPIEHVQYRFDMDLSLRRVANITAVLDLLRPFRKYKL